MIVKNKILPSALFLLVWSTMLTGQAHWESLVLESDIFKYSVPETEPSADWIELDFDDSSWDAGPGGFGYSDDDDQTIVPATTSVYLRKTITIPTSTPILQLLLDIDYDDAFVAYINGTEVARSYNLPAGTPGLTAELTTDHEAVMWSGGTPERFRLDPGMLVEGENILAVHILNISITSSDLSARVFLNAEIDSESILFSNTPDWFTAPVSNQSSNIPIIKINTEGQAIVDEPKIMALMKVIDNPDGVNGFYDTTYTYDGHIGIEIRGNTAQMFPKKSYTVETRVSTGENNNVPLLGMPRENDWVFHGPYSDKSLMRNALAYNIGRSMGRWHPRTRFVELIINDEYRGVYLVAEKIKIDNNRVDIATLLPEDISGDELTGGYIMSIDRDQEGSWNSPFLGRTGSVDVPFSYVDPKYDELTVEQRNYIREYITDFEYALHGDNFMDPDLGYRAYIDVQSFVDYFIITELSRDLDGYRVSVYFHKDKDSNGGKLVMSPFWDYNICFGNADFMQAGNPVGWTADGIGNGDWYEVPFWWDKFRQDPFFETILKNRWETLREYEINKTRINSVIDSCSILLDEAQVRNFEKWPVLNQHIWPNNYVGGTYENEVNYLKDWISDRLEWLDAQIAKIVPLEITTPWLVTSDVSGITRSSAIVGGDVTSDGGSDVMEKGIRLDTISTPVLNAEVIKVGVGEGPFETTLTALASDKVYYYQAYAINEVGTSYGVIRSFRTKSGMTLPSVITLQATNITENTAFVGGDVTDNGGTTVTEKGIYWGTTTSPEVNGTKVIIGSGGGSFVASLTALEPDNEYYYKAYAINSTGESFGEERSFRTNEGPSGLYENPPIDKGTVLVYPNPFTSDITIEFYTGTSGRVDVSFTNMLGQKVSHQSMECQVGINRMVFHNEDFPSGNNLFFYTLTIDDTPVSTGKILRK